MILVARKDRSSNLMARHCRNCDIEPISWDQVYHSGCHDPKYRDGYYPQDKTFIDFNNSFQYSDKYDSIQCVNCPIEKHGTSHSPVHLKCSDFYPVIPNIIPCYMKQKKSIIRTAKSKDALAYLLTWRVTPLWNNIGLSKYCSRMQLIWCDFLNSSFEDLPHTNHSTQQTSWWALQADIPRPNLSTILGQQMVVLARLYIVPDRPQWHIQR